MARPVLAVGLDLASVNAAAVAVPPAGLGGEVVEVAITAPPKEEVDQPVRSLVMADRLYEALGRLSVDPSFPSSTFRVLAIEYTPFLPGQVGASSTGVVRGALYAALRQRPIFELVILCTPSQWRAFHGLSGFTGKAKYAAYTAHAESLGFTTTLSGKQAQDAVTAFLLARVAAALPLPSAELEALPRNQFRVIDGLVSNPNMRIFPE